MFNYQVKNFVCRAFNIKEGTSSVISEPLFRGNVPSYLVITFVLTSAFQGNKDKQCFNFQPFGISQISAKVNGETKLYENLQFDFENNLFMQGFHSLKSALAPFANHGITAARYKSGQFMVCLGINPNHSSNSIIPERKGDTQVDIRFKNNLTAAVTCIVLGKFQGEIQIDPNRVVSTHGF
jgi:hypothetical protein